MKFYVKKHTKAQLCHHRKKKAECCKVSLDVVDPDPPVDRAYDLLIAPWFVSLDYGYKDRTTYVEVGPVDNINVGDQVVDAYNVISPHDFILNRFDEQRNQIAPLDKYQDVSNITWTWEYGDELGNPDNDNPVINTIDAGLVVVREEPTAFYAAVSYSVTETVPLGHTIDTDRNTWQPVDAVTVENQPTVIINWEKIVADQKTIYLTLKCEVEFTDPDAEDPMEILTATAELPYIFRWDGPPQVPPSNQIRKEYHMTVVVEPALNVVEGEFNGFINPFPQKNGTPEIEYGQFEIEEGLFPLPEDAYTNNFTVKSEILALTNSYDLESVEITEYRGVLPPSATEPDKGIFPTIQPGYEGSPYNSALYIKGANDADLTLMKIGGLSTRTDPLNDLNESDWSCFVTRFKGRVNSNFFDTTFIHYYYVPR